MLLDPCRLDGQPRPDRQNRPSPSKATSPEDCGTAPGRGSNPVWWVAARACRPLNCLSVSGLGREQVQCRLVWLPAVEFRNGNGEFRVWRNGTEQCHGRAEFEVVGTAQDFEDRTALDSVDEGGALLEPGAEDVVHQIGD